MAEGILRHLVAQKGEAEQVCIGMAVIKYLADCYAEQIGKGGRFL